MEFSLKVVTQKQCEAAHALAEHLDCKDDQAGCRCSTNFLIHFNAGPPFERLERKTIWQHQQFTVHTRIAMLENAVTELKKENSELSVHLKGALETAVNDAKNTIQDSIRIPQDGRDGREGVDGATGATGPVGTGWRRRPASVPMNCLWKSKKLRRAIVERHAANIARIVHNIEVLGRPEHQSNSYRHFRSLLHF